FGFTTVVVQSFVDFGLHIPAIALLATVVCAQLCAAGSFRGQPNEGGWPKSAAKRREEAAESSRLPHSARNGMELDASKVYSLRLWGLAPVVGAVLTVLFGLLLCYEGRRTSKASGLSALPPS